jgi:hypothetical protein
MPARRWHETSTARAIVENEALAGRACGIVGDLRARGRRAYRAEVERNRGERPTRRMKSLVPVKTARPVAVNTGNAQLVATAEILRGVKGIGDDALLNHLFIHVYLPHTRCVVSELYPTAVVSPLIGRLCRFV